ncbi:MAG: hypothetical protein U5J63_10815 [Fodinibius sp.]|nr:hypothetical protein [Fodinibius sp.]
MEMDFSTFNNQKVDQQKAKSAQNFSRAAFTALVMKGIVELNLAIPRALLTAANNSDAELNGDGDWEWNFTKTARDTSFEVRLRASRTSQDSVYWAFNVTNPSLDLDNQLFFDGTTNADGTEGRWAYYNWKNTATQQQVSRVNWTVNAEDNLQLTLEVTSDRNGNQGDYIDYTFEDSLKTVIYYDNSEDEQTEIQFNVNSKAGYIIAPDFNSGNKACWDGEPAGYSLQRGVTGCVTICSPAPA